MNKDRCGRPLLLPTPKIYETQAGIYAFRKPPSDSDLISFHHACLASDEIAFIKDGALGKEAYILAITKAGIQIHSSCETGTFRTPMLPLFRDPLTGAYGIYG